MTHYRIAAWLIAGMVSILTCIGCSSSIRLVASRPSKQFGPATTFDGSESSIQALYRQVRSAFSDTLDTLIETSRWDHLHHQITGKDDTVTVPVSSNIAIMENLLKDAGYNVFTLHPSTYEAFRCVANIPVLACLAYRDINPRKAAPPERSELPDTWVRSYGGNLSDLRFAIVREIQILKNKLVLHTADTQTLSGLSQDTVIGQVYTSVGSDSVVHYRQIIGSFFITQIPEVSTAGEIAEWYDLMPAEVVRPKIEPLR